MTENLPEIGGGVKPETLYHGSKHYWKQRCHVDYTIYWHKSKNIIEIASYNSDAHEEGERLFIDPDKLFERVDKEEVETKVRSKQEEMMRQRKPRVLAEELAKTITAQMAVHLIVQRAVIRKELPEGVKFAVDISPQSGDECQEDGRLIYMRDRPEDFVDTAITRNKKASSSEFRQTLQTLQKDSKKLALECNKAARKAGLAKSAVSGFTGSLRRYTYDPNTQSPALIRFLKAGRRIIAMNTVRKVTDLLERLERKSMGDIPSPVRTDFKSLVPEIDPMMMNASVSLPTLADLHNQSRNGRRVRRPHHRLKPVRKFGSPSTGSLPEAVDFADDNST